ncbi:hypothetical protein KFE25_004429 [Diacronema lutheri]|uniref:Uncharacterized protein n=2 Tax=Eukaryota TaxID=2759 RepID=A0A7R9YMG5_DIALT|nr:hypothetical protein KFE25_004429 [Diacronema lutheri]
MLSLVTAALAFSGSAAPSRVSRSAVQMSDAANTRREVLVRSVAAVSGLVFAAEQASAKAGQGANQAFFGIKLDPSKVTVSEPFEIDTQIGKRGDTLASKEKYANLAKKFAESEKRIGEEVPKYINKGKWALGRGQMRSYVYEMRASMVQTNKGLSKDKLTKATSLYKKFIRDVEAIDFAMSQKDKEGALEAVTTAKKSLSKWKEYVA